MLENILHDLKWKCCTKEDGEWIEISNHRDNTEIEYDDNRRNSAEKEYDSKIINNKIDGYLVDLIEELYYVVALENIDSNENNTDKETLMRQLQQEEEKYHTLLRLKQLYYTEVQTSIERINVYLKNGEKTKTENKFILEEMTRFDGIIYHPKLILHTLDHLCEDNSRLFKKIMNAIIDFNNCFEKYHFEINNEDYIKYGFKLSYLFRNIEFGIVGEIIWLMFWLNIFRNVCSDETHYKWLYLDIDLREDLEEQLEEQLSKYIIDTNSMVESVFGRKICDAQHDMMMCYLPKTIKPDIFDKKISCLANALQQVKQLKKYWKSVKEGRKCIAIMHSNSKQYVALSGSEHINKYSTDIQKILGIGYEVVGLNSDVRYYHTKKKYITFEQYTEWRKFVTIDEHKVPVRRMFSCCERKLLTKLYNEKNVNYTIYVKKKPCSMCKKALKDYDKDQNCCGLIKYPEKNDFKKNNKKDRDKNDNIIDDRKKNNKKQDFILNEVAKCVRDGVFPDPLFFQDNEELLNG